MNDNRKIILDTAKVGGFLPRAIGYQECCDLDGSHARAFLEAAGFKVVSNRDTGRNGIAITEEGIHLSTNGYCHTAHLS